MTTSRWMRLSGTLALVVIGTAPIGLLAQDTLSAGLMRRIAEAADGNRTGRLLYFVVTTRAPYYDVLAAFPNDSAAREFQSTHPGTKVVGPSYAPPDPEQPEPTVLTSGCYHDRTLTRYICGDTTRVIALRVSQVKEIIITVVALDTANSRTTRYSPDHADAFFFTLSAVDKFVIPYYQWVYGAEYAADLRRQSLSRFATRP